MPTVFWTKLEQLQHLAPPKSSQRFGFIEDDRKQQIIKSSLSSIHEEV